MGAGAGIARQRSAGRAHHNVYVIELDGRVLNHARFRAANPNRDITKLYAYANPMPYDAARDMVVELAIALQEEGYAVWQA